ncbi:MAG TPA: hypothetical protein DEF45_04405 [Rhodopirellula sp.]|nr:hypothetical protein [Rhodopirellula sp.]
MIILSGGGFTAQRQNEVNKIWLPAGVFGLSALIRALFPTVSLVKVKGASVVCPAWFSIYVLRLIIAASPSVCQAAKTTVIE